MADRLGLPVGFDGAFSFVYSRRPGTPAANLDDPIPHETKIAWLMRLQAQIDRQISDYNKRPKRLTFFATRHDGDPATEQTTSELVFPLAEVFTASRPGWDVRLVAGPQATRAGLGRLMGGPETPALLFTATHGMVFPPDDPYFSATQGALVCQEWPGPGHGVLPEMSFAAADVRDPHLRPVAECCQSRTEVGLAEVHGF